MSTDQSDTTAPEGSAPPGFGSGRYAPTQTGETHFGSGPDGSSGRRAPREPSVVDANARGGGSNVTGGVARRKKRVLNALSGPVYEPVAKNYNTSDAVLFNNYDELLQDKVSREYAQEIIEEFFELCAIDTSQPDVAKYAEDALFIFLIATTASNKADYDKQLDVPAKSGTIELDFSKLSHLLQYGHGVTRRNFARGLADSLRSYLKKAANRHILPAMATRVGCDPQFAHLAFDGSTHCSGMTTREVSFTKTLEARNLFESDEVLASGASERLMQGMPAGVKSLVPR